MSAEPLGAGFTVAITVNGPGEVATWAAPVVAELARSFPEARVGLFLLPCRFAAGTEADVLRHAMPDLTVFTPAQSRPYITHGQAPEGWRPTARGVVLFLGGEPLLARLLARRLGYPCWGFVAKTDRPSRYFDVSLLEAEIGHPIVDGQRSFAADLTGSPQRLVFFPGSRPQHANLAVQVYRGVIEALGRHELPADLQLRVARSPFLDLDRVSEDARRFVLEHEASPEELLHIRLAVAIPGSMTVELGARGVPFVLVLPIILRYARHFHFPGLAGILGNLPLIGPPIKMLIIRGIRQRHALMALPNQRAGRQIAPEVAGRVTPEDIADTVAELLADPPRLATIAAELQAAMGPPGAPGRIVARLREYAQAGVAA